MKNVFDSRNFQNWLAIGLGVSFILSCTSIQTNQENSKNPTHKSRYGSLQNQERAELYIYRPYRFGSQMAEPYVSINGEFIGSIHNKSYRGFSISPGEYFIETGHGPDWLKGNPSKLVLPITKGNRYFVRIDTETTFDAGNFFLGLFTLDGGLFVGADFLLILVEEENGLKDLFNMDVYKLRANVH